MARPTNRYSRNVVEEYEWRQHIDPTLEEEEGGSDHSLSPSRWWGMKLDESPSDEEAGSEVEESTIGRGHHRLSKCVASAIHHGRQNDCKQSLPSSTDPCSSYRQQCDAEQQSQEICQGKSILSMLGKNLCAGGQVVSSPVLRKIDESATMKKFEKQMARWDFIGAMVGSSESHESCSDSGSSQSSHSNTSEGSSTAPKDGTDGDDSVFSNLENEELSVQEPPSKSIRQSNLMKDRMSKIRSVAAATLDPLNAGFFEERQAAPLTPRNRHDTSPAAAGAGVIGVPQQKQSVRDVCHLLNAVAASDLLPVVENTSTLTEERQQHAQFSDGTATKTCVPSVLQKQLEKFRKQKDNVPEMSVPSQGSGESSVRRMVTQSFGDLESQAGERSYYTYDYESPNHAYVAYIHRGQRASESVRHYEHPTPELFDTLKSEAVVKIDAATVSATDCAVRSGYWWGESSAKALATPIVPGTGFTGRIANIDRSRNRSGFKKGDRVVSLVRVGANSRHLCIETDRLVKVPQELSAATNVACLPEIYLGAFQALMNGKRNTARYKKNALAHKRIIVLGGTTMMGTALIEVARAHGCETVYATAREKEFEKILLVGGLPLSRDPKHWLSLLAAKTDIVVGLDFPYGKAQVKPEHVQMLNSKGMILVLGGPEKKNNGSFDLDSCEESSTAANRKLHHLNVFESWDNDMKQAKKDLAHLLKLLKDHHLQPTVAERIPLDKIPKAHEYLDAKQVKGFILCEPWISGRERMGSSVVLSKASKSVSSFSRSKSSVGSLSQDLQSQSHSQTSARSFASFPKAQTKSRGFLRKTRSSTSGGAKHDVPVPKIESSPSFLRSIPSLLRSKSQSSAAAKSRTSKAESTGTSQPSLGISISSLSGAMSPTIPTRTIDVSNSSRGTSPAYQPSSTAAAFGPSPDMYSPSNSPPPPPRHYQQHHRGRYHRNGGRIGYASDTVLV